jgi:hypothetical protein
LRNLRDDFLHGISGPYLQGREFATPNFG